MSYTLNKSNGNILGVINDNTVVDNLASVRFVGRNTLRYGEIHQEGLLHILENFASSVEPAFSLKGQIWFDTNVNKLKVCMNESPVEWKSLTFVNIVQPSNPETGELWWNVSLQALFAFNGTTWVRIGPDDPSITRVVNTVTTNSGSPSAVVATPLEDNSSYLITYKVVARDVVTKTNNGSWIVTLNAYRADSSNAIIVGAENYETIAKSAGVAEDWNTEISVDGVNVRLIVNGISGGNNIVWKVYTETFKNN